VRVLGPTLALHALPITAFREVLCQPLEAPLRAEIQTLLTETNIAPKRQPALMQALLRERLAPRRVRGAWLLRLSPSVSPWQHAWHAGLFHNLAVFAGAHALQYWLWLMAWGVIGSSVLTAQIQSVWLWAWALLLVTIVPLRMLVTWVQGHFSLKVGIWLKRRLLAGVLKLDPDEIRSEGIGQVLGRVLESEVIETVALKGGFWSVTALLELLLAGIVLVSASGWTLGLLLVGWTALTLFWGWRYGLKRKAWTQTRVRLTHQLVEKMAGHRTRLAQESRATWHVDEDQALSDYFALANQFDQAYLQMNVWVARGWILLGFIGLTSAFVLGTATPLVLAVSVGGVISAYLALRKFSAGLSHLLGAWVAWQQVALIFNAAVRVAKTPAGVTNPEQTTSDGKRSDDWLLQAHNMSFHYTRRAESVLRGCQLNLRSGERVLLEGPSGGGKSTLAALLGALRQPTSGLLLLKGLDYQTLSPTRWRQLVAMAPQFHENYVFVETFAFNLLMGRAWPASPEDLAEAEAVCRELNLGDLLQRMPAKMLQMVGEMGWQLSHGERSRLYIARALLQRAELIILDESFAALDPETLRVALQCVLRRAKTLLVIAHP
jgi:ATP-binding cassette subfamily B protein